ncbi:GNAT family N-acetyltransferase [Silicimonas sp. MF1-12-2]|uniref:GNAT family N-acetyltransferase n=1 Tax=Silicimonas sp. MF1-12-2 TaxID=3384793 RepID=UPI0039B4919A
MDDIRVQHGAAEFTDWEALHRLLTRAFAGMEGRIDPPSSLHRMDPHLLREKAAHESLVVAYRAGRLVGCGFGAKESDMLYLSKLAVDPDLHRRGILRRMVMLFEEEARRRALAGLVLQTRVELTENHATFRALGFEISAETAHPGYDRPTSYTFRKMI